MESQAKVDAAPSALRCSQLPDDDVVASIEWLRETALDEDTTFNDQRSFYIRAKDGICVALVSVDACDGGWSTPKLFGNASYPYGLISDKPTRGRIRTLCEVVGQAY